jgi:hypothetical protein
LRALKAHKVFVGLHDPATNLYSLERGDYLEKKVLPEFVPMWILNEFKRKIDIPIHHFWNPEVAESETTGKEPSAD